MLFPPELMSSLEVSLIQNDKNLPKLFIFRVTVCNDQNEENC